MGEMFVGNKLTRSIGKNNLEEVQLWLGAGIDPNSTDADGNSAIFLATFTGNTNIMKELLVKGANANLVKGGKTSALEVAVEKDRIDLVTLLVQYGANPNRVNRDGHTPLSIAQSRHLDDLVRIMNNEGL